MNGNTRDSMSDRWKRGAKTSFAIVVALVATGCSTGDGLPRVEVRGVVKHDGKPVERGLITFRPDQNARGPIAGTGIENGKYSITRAKGPIAGSYVVEVKLANRGETTETARGGNKATNRSRRLK